jgi:hypothetical protein
MKERIKHIVSQRNIWLVIFALFAIGASIQSLSGTKTYEEGGLVYNRYNNYTIFEKSFDHLKNQQDLYIHYPEEHWDLYKYTPSFSVFFALFNILPDWMGLSLWNLLNAFMILFAVYYLPKLSNYQKGLILAIVLVELMTSMQNAQSNGLIAGLLVMSFALMEKNKPFWAALCIVFSMFIKLFGIVGFAIFLFYPKKWKLALFSLFWVAALFVLPLFFVDFEQNLNLYSSYLGLLGSDHSASYGYSVMGWIHTWLSVEVNKNLIVAIGVLVFLAPYYKIKFYNEFTFKYLVLASVLLWIVIFNHKAESPTFIIAMTGVALWFVNSEKNTLNIILFISAMLFTSLSPTDIFPRHVRIEIFKPYVVKAVPCILIWMKIIYDTLMLRKEESTIQTHLQV